MTEQAAGLLGSPLLVPEGCAHGKLTLMDATEVEYLITAPYRPDASRGYRWNDPSLAIVWPVPIKRISARDAALPYLERQSPA